MSVKQLPNPFTWKYVLVHKYYRNPDPRIISNYNGTTTSFMSLHRGIAKPTFVTNDIYMMQRYIKLGWDDITEQVRPHVKEAWDKLKMKWKVDDDGMLPWERKPRPAKVETLIEEEPPALEDEVEIPQEKTPPKPRRKVRGVAKPKPRPKK